MALTVCVRHITGLPGIHDRQVKLCFRGETCMNGLRAFRIGEFYILHSLDSNLNPCYPINLSPFSPASTSFPIFYFSLSMAGN